MKQHVKLFVNILLGNILLAFAICAFVVPNGFMLGGANGIALTLQHWLPLRLSQLTAILNGILFLVGLIFMGKQFAATTLLSTVLYPMIVAVFEEFPLDQLFTPDPLAAAIFAGAVAGLGIGIVVRCGGSTGGMDIPPCILQKYKGIPVGTSIVFFDSVVVLAQVIISGTSGLLYSLIIIAMTSLTINHTIVSGESKVELIIISPAYEQIRSMLLNQLDVGATMLNIETGYEHKDQKAVFTVVYTKKYPIVRDAVLMLDPKAFIVTSEVKNVNGRGYTLARSTEES